MSRTYVDFDVSVRAEPGGYRITARFGDETAERTFPDPFDQADLTAFYDMFGGARRRGPEATEHLERARAFGDRLYQSVFADELDKLLVASKRTAEAAGQGVRIRLHLGEAPVLVNLPWEYLYRKAADDFPVLSSWTPLVRYLPVEDGVPPVRVKPPLKILVMISDPIEYKGTLDTEAEWDSLLRALDAKRAAGLVEVERLEVATEAELQVVLGRTDVHVFHFIGHGEFDTAEQDGVLRFEDEHRRTTPVTGRALGDTLKDSRSLRLVVLNNCEGARAADLDPFTGVAQSLIRKGIPAVVAMQFEVTDQAAREFSRGFYGGIGDGFPVDGALAEGRKFMSRVAGGFEFGSPVLYLAAPTGEIFDVAVAPPPPDPAPIPTSRSPSDDRGRGWRTKKAKGRPSRCPPMMTTQGYPADRGRSNRSAGGGRGPWRWWSCWRWRSSSSCALARTRTGKSPGSPRYPALPPAPRTLPTAAPTSAPSRMASAPDHRRRRERLARWTGLPDAPRGGRGARPEGLLGVAARLGRRRPLPVRRGIRSRGDGPACHPAVVALPG